MLGALVKLNLVRQAGYKEGEHWVSNADSAGEQS
jgi:hypothetical protein